MDYKEKVIELLKSKELSKEEKEKLENIFPELKESEDERIRKALIRFHKSTIDVDGIKGDDILAWLEKQGQKPFDYEHATIAQKDFAPKIESKFKIGDWVVTSYGKVNQVVSVDKDGDGYTLDDDTYFSGSWCNMYHLWTIADAKDGDVLHSPSHRLIWNYKDNKHYHTCINMNYVTENIAIDGLIEIPSDVCPATTVQRSILFSKMEGAGYEWNSKKRKLKKISQRMISAWAKESGYSKPTDEGMVEALRTEYEKGMADAIAEMQKEWSKEDEIKINRIVACLENLNVADNDILLKDVDWLKSLKDRYTWKPSKGQLECLGYAINKAEKDYSPLANNRIYLTLKALKEELEKLKGE